MIYILIILWGGPASDHAKSSLAVEFNSVQACKTAGDLLMARGVEVALCVPKGKS